MTADKRAFALRFRQNLAWHREEAGLSQNELAFRAELHRTEVGMLERGVRLPRADTLLKVARSLAIDPGALLAGLGYTPHAVQARQGQVR